MNIKLFLLASAAIVIGGVRKHPTPSFKNRPLYIRVDYAKTCDDNPPDTKEGNVTVTYEGSKLIVNGFGYLYRRIERIEKIIAIVRQCKNRAEEANCEHFQTWRFGREACFMAEQKNMLWSPILDATEPKIKCPIAKGVYYARNATFDSQIIQQVFAAIPFEKYFWRARIETYDYKMFLCAEFGVNYLRGKS